MWFAVPAMLDTPLNVFGCSSDAAGVAELVAHRLPDAGIRRDSDSYVVTSAPKRRLLRSAGRDVTVNIGTGHFAGDAGRRQILGMSNFVRGGMGGPGIADLLAMIPGLRVAVAFMADPPITTDASDDLFRLAVEVARAADGFVLSIGAGRAWSSDGFVLASTDQAPRDVASPPDGRSGDEEDLATDPPSGDQVKRRLIVLTAVAARGFAEAEGEFLDEARRGILRWVDGLDVGAELEPPERAVLEAAAGRVPQMDQVKASWRTEGAAVLAWALGVLDLTPHDQPIDSGDLSSALGFPDPDSTRAVTSALAMRPRSELDQLAERLFAVHWRLREQSLRPRALDFAEFARTAWFGPLDLEGVSLVDGDLGLGGRAIADADPAAVATATSVVMERHLAANWLRHGSLYSETDTST